MKNSFVIMFGIASAWALMNILFPVKVMADDKEYFWSDSGALIIIENAESSSYSYDQDGNFEIQVEPSSSERTYIYGEDGGLTVIQPSSLGTFAY